MSDRNRHRIPDDPAVPALSVLLGPDSRDLLAEVLSQAGGRLGSARATQVRYVPSRSVTVQYRCDVQWHPDSATTVETLVATTESPIPDHLPSVEVDGSPIRVWRYPHDPFLPGLAVASDETKVGEVLGLLGAPADGVDLRRRAYRPGRRAVIEVLSPRTRIFLKVVRPKRVGGLQARHAALAQHVPIPHSYGWSGDLGLVAMQSLPGKTLRKRLEGGSRQLPDPAQLLTLLEGIGAAEPAGGEVGGPAARVQDYARLLSAVAPDLTTRLESIVGEVAKVPSGSAESVHGDFHSSQILVKGPEVVGLIDIDTVGVGDRADDLATLLGHVSTLALTSASRKAIERYGQELMAAFDQLTSPRDLRLRTAAVVLGFATGPFRVQHKRWPEETERRVVLAEQWIRTAAA